ncbi:MAG TPA: DUF5715 family protein [Longimicrobiales bacterium]
MMNRLAATLCLLLFAAACSSPDPSPATAPDEDVAAREVDGALSDALAAASAGADSVIAALLPVPLMTAAQEDALRRYGNAQHLARARALGARPASADELEQLVASGRLVRVPDTTSLYVVRDADPEKALLVPAAIALLEETARRFQAELRERGLPAYRLEVSSMLRSAEDQAELRRTNPNAASGTSTHEFGTTLDIVYESWAAPAELPDAYVAREPAWLVPHTELAARALLERAAARKSRELMAILGAVLREMQAEGLVYVTLERQQPVYHITVARALR